MNILILGYGKMGKTIEKIAIERGNNIVKTIDREDQINESDLKGVQVAIEFTQPDAAYDNITFCLQHNLPVLSGTTGWLERKKEVEAFCKKNNGTFFYASNYSIGVNLFFKLNKFLSQMMRKHPSYNVSVEEVHHTEKKDSPSGTAITLAEGILDNFIEKKGWVNEPTDDKTYLEIHSYREPGIPGTHTIKYNSDLDEIMIKHTAHKRESFALGAVLVAEWLVGKKGVLSMDDFLKL
ncbi:MAG: 4-hydroxy-tetrahydrodipicolinate reductase [Bacteroidota bacterium]|nr:4-hydroxy-tetrahydrodipicolinate reductase [Bacteroidota bacterium]